MIKTAVVFVFIIFQLVSYAQDLDYKTRSNLQVDFIFEYCKRNDLLGKRFISTNEIDKRVAQLSDAWVKHIEVDDPVLKRFDGYPLLIIANIAGAEEWAEKYIFANYIATNLVEDISFITQKTHIPAIHLLNMPTYANMISFSLNTPLKVVHWNALYSSFMKLPPIIDTTLIQYEFEEYFDKTLLYIKKSLLESEKNFDLLNAIYNEHLDLGFTLLFTSFTQNEITKNNLINAGKLLVKKFMVTNRNEQAFATIDLLAQFTIEAELHRDSLKVWYENVNNDIGKEKFSSLIQKPSNSILTKTDIQYQLSGTYLDLTNNEQIDLSKFDGKYVLIDFWATWCGPCKIEIPDLNSFHSRFHTKENFVFVTVVSDAITNGVEKDEIKKFIKKHNINYKVLYDTKENSLTKQFKVNGWPDKYLLDKNGYMLERTKGERINLELAETYLKGVVE